MPRTVRPAPLSIRLSDNERSDLERRANGAALSGYVKSVLFADNAKRSNRRHSISADRIQLAQILGQLGAGGLASNIRQLTEAADSGSLDLDDLTINQLRHAACDVRGIHMLLMRALGKDVPSGLRKADRPSIQFRRSAFDPKAAQCRQHNVRGSRPVISFIFKALVQKKYRQEPHWP